MNPVTKLWEFYDLRSAWDGSSDPASIAIPIHDPSDGSIEMTAATGIVFVLLPGGTFMMGAQHESPDQPNFDSNAQDVEFPDEVTLAPFFLARHELTRAQWQRLTTGVPPFWFQEGATNYHDPFPTGPTHPAESIDWNEADLCMRQHGLVLPTEAQWEYGCRAGTTTPWWTGADAKSLEGAANVLDHTAAKNERRWSGGETYEDGFTVLSPVGSFRANPFGLFDVHGNVFEWCRDRESSYAMPARPGDGVRRLRDATAHLVRGGGYQAGAVTGRATDRSVGPSSIRFSYLGLRPARSCSPEQDGVDD
jgi:formylglycine-generating enzyme required for sulfatase activity